MLDFGLQERQRLSVPLQRGWGWAARALSQVGVNLVMCARGENSWSHQQIKFAKRQAWRLKPLLVILPARLAGLKYWPLLVM